MKNNIKKGLESTASVALYTALDIPLIKYGISFSRDILESFKEYDSLGKMDSLFLTGITVLGTAAITAKAIYSGKKAYDYFFNKKVETSKTVN